MRWSGESSQVDVAVQQQVHVLSNLLHHAPDLKLADFAEPA